MIARDGDWLFSPFQCERCWFINIFEREPYPTVILKDRLLLNILRRANLDIFWSRESTTIKQSLGRVKTMISQWKGRYGVSPFPIITPWKVGDDMGMKAVIVLLEKSLDPGKLADYTQFDTCRQYRSTLSNMFYATAAAVEKGQSMKSLQGKVFHLAQDPFQTALVERFVRGMKSRMPVESLRNLPLSGLVVRRLLDVIESEWVEPSTPAARTRLLAMVGAYISLTYSYSLRGNEGFWVDGDLLVENIEVGKYDSPIPHVLVPVIGFFKGESGERMHVFSIANNNKSGTRPRIWLERVVKILRAERKVNCPAFCDVEGYMLGSDDIEAVMHPILRNLQGAVGLEQALPSDVDVEMFYRCERSFRRGAENTALVRKVSDKAIAFVHRWSIFERNRGKLPSFDMLQYYADGESTRPLQLEFTSAV